MIICHLFLHFSSAKLTVRLVIGFSFPGSGGEMIGCLLAGCNVVTFDKRESQVMAMTERSTLLFMASPLHVADEMNRISKSGFNMH